MEAVGEPFDPWQEWTVKHALEVMPDGSFRFRIILIVVARQNGKSHLKRGVTLWRMFMYPKTRVLGVAQEMTLAREQWNMCQDTVHADPDLDAEWAGTRNVNGDEYFWLANGSRYRIGAANRKAGRGGSNDEVNIDELREQRDWKAWAALSKTTMARDNSQIWAMSNAGDDESVVLNQLLEVARAGTDPTIFLAEYSAEDDCELDDWNQIRQANPNLGRRVSESAIRTALSTDPPPVFRTEVLCQRVQQLDIVIDPAAWAACADPGGVFTMRRGKTYCCIDAAPDGQHVTLAVAMFTDDGRPRVAIAGAWKDTDAARGELEGLLDKIRPRAIAWFPSGPGAALAGIIRRRPNVTDLGGGRAAEACQEFTDLIRTQRMLHPGDALLDAQAAAAVRLPTGDGWRFSRRDGGHVDAVYAAAGAVHLALANPIIPASIRVLA